MLSHDTAAEYYLTLDPLSANAAVPTRAKPLNCARATSISSININPNFSGFGGLPLHVLVSEKGLVRRSNIAVAHVCEAALPQGSFRKLNDTLFIVSPELCFLQMAWELSLPKLVEFGINLCASYYRDLKKGDLPERPPIVSARKLLRYVENMSGKPGAAKAKKALQWIKDNSASPMETKLFILLVFPKRYGGYGFSDAVFNFEIDPERYAFLTEQDSFKIDICFPDKHVGVEYYGEESHQDTVKDRRRLDALGTLGWDMTVIDKQRLYDPQAFDIAAHQIAQHLGQRIRKPANWDEKNFELRYELGLCESS